MSVVTLLTSLALLLTGVAAAAQTSNSQGDRTIAQLRGNVYRASDAARTTVFLVTAEGILLVDPLNFEFAFWLESELERRFPGQPVKYVVYSRLDFDRIGGAGVFNDTAEIIAVDKFNPGLSRSRALLPPRFVVFDRDNSGALERGELASLDESPILRRNDRNGDGHLTPGEMWGAVLPAEDSYQSRRAIVLGGVRIELVHPGPVLGDEMTVTYFPAERLVFAPTYPSMTAPFTGRSIRPSEVATWARTVGSLDFDTLVAAGGEIVTRDQVRALSNYVETLVEGVTAGYEDGRSIEQLQQGTAIDRFSGTPYSSTRDADIAYVYRRTNLLMFDAGGAILVGYAPFDPQSCRAAVTCQFGPASGTGSSAGIGLSVRRWRFAGEISVGHQVKGTAVQQFRTVSLARRDTLISGLVGYRSSAARTVNVALLAGPTVARTRAASVSRVSRVGPPSQPDVSTTMSLGVTFGADVSVPIGNWLRLTIPFRAIKLRDTGRDSYRPTIDVRAGLGLSITLWQHVN
jgi:hypothetical protein